MSAPLFKTQTGMAPGNSGSVPCAPSTKGWKEIVAKYQEPLTPRALWQIVNTFIPYVLLWYSMYRSLAVSWWLTAPLAVLAGAFLVRIFIIFTTAVTDSISNRARPMPSSDSNQGS